MAGQAPAPILALLALLPGLAACPADVSGVADVPERPDLLLITVDTLRADALTCYGSGDGAGEAICSLGRDGSRFAWAFATAPSTAPSVASILTSRYPRDHGVGQDFRTRLPDDATTLAERLGRAGYATAAFVSNPVLMKVRNLDQGFDTYDDRMTRRERNRPRVREREAEATTGAALDWIDRHSGGERGSSRPWFVWIHYQDPHGPYDPPARSPGGAPGEPGSREEARAGPVLPLLADHSGWRGLPAYQRLPGIADLGGYRERYADEIRYLDRHVARLLQGATREGRPLGVLLTADHGEAFGEDDYYCAHGHSVGLDQIRVPLLWRPPDASGAPDRGRASGRIVERPVSTLDVAPTLLAAAGIGGPAADGAPLEGAPLDEVPDERILFAEHEIRTAVIAGDAYYARDRLPLERPVRDPVTGGVLPPLPPRTATLSGDGALPGYRPVPLEGQGAAAFGAMDALLDRYLGSRRADRLDDSIPVDPETREALRALGYLK